MSVDFLALQSGTDVRGVAADCPGREITLTDEAVSAVTDGFLLWLSEQTGKPADRLTVAVGHDSRVSADRISAAVVRAAVQAGCRVCSCGLSSTPAMFFATLDLPCDGAIQITASHHPWYLNGLKFFTRSGGMEGNELSSILERCASGQHPVAAAGGSAQDCCYMKQYAARLRTMICQSLSKDESQQPLSGMHIVVDAGNGVGGFYAADVLEPLGADISGSQFLEPDGRFPNHIPNPENEEAMQAICHATVNAKADLGMIFDTDVDRAGCVDRSGNEINRNRLIALAAVMALEDHPGGTIVTDSVTSDGLHTFLTENLKGRHRRFKRGYRNVIDEAQRLCREGTDAPLAMETSGHAAFSDNYFLDDGAYLMTKVLLLAARRKEQGRELLSLIEAMPEPLETAEYRLPLPQNHFREAGQSLIDRTAEAFQHIPGFTVADDSCEGVRVSADATHGDGWFLLRVSVHDPVMPLNLESNRKGGIEAMLAALKTVAGIAPTEK